MTDKSSWIHLFKFSALKENFLRDYKIVSLTIFRGNTDKNEHSRLMAYFCILSRIQ